MSNCLTATINIGSLPGVQAQGVSLSSIAISPDGTRVYVSNGIGNQIWAIDTASNQVTATIPTTAVLGFACVSISTDGGHLYAASIGNPSVVDVIDTKTTTVAASISLPGSDVPTRIGLTPDGSHAYVTGVTGNVWVLDTTRNAVVTTVSVTAGQPLVDIAFAPDGSHAYVTCGSNNAIYVLDTTTYRVVGQKSRSDYPGGLAIAPTLFGATS